ncbi:MAG: [LysW]-aminoadipate kinase [Chloroflexi bacterium]|nr:MAG: [LysW]-aminoadipate kinase [Chloroflexota bacterium]
MIVVKMGGAQGVNLSAVCQDVAELIRQGEAVVFVHGGSNETNELSEKLGMTPRFITTVTGFTSRYTDRKTLETFCMATAKINMTLVEHLQKAGVNALGLSGVDGKLLCAKRNEAIKIVENGKRMVIRDDFTGKIEQVNAGLIQMLLSAGLTPVIQPMAISEAGDALNVDADRAAAIIAGAIHAQQLILLTHVPGLLRSFPDESSLITHIDRRSVETALEVAEGRMKKKVLGAIEALELGVEKIVFADGRVEHPLLGALGGQGTTIS